MSDNVFRNAIQRISHELAADKKKATVLGGLSVVLLVVVGRAALSGPEPDIAVTAATVAQPAPARAPARDPVAPAIRPEPQQVVPMLEAIAAGKGSQAERASVSHAASSPPIKQRQRVSVADLPRTFTRNIFTTTAWSRFEADHLGKGSDVAEPKPEPWLSQVRSSLAEARQRREERRAALNAELASLALQSTMTGARPAAYISGRLVRIGDKINGFSVLAIDDKRVELEKNGQSVELSMP